jgi:hypothetical protein
MKELVNIVVALCGRGRERKKFFFGVFLRIDDDEDSCSF